MARRDLNKLLEEGKLISKKTNSTIWSDELNWLHDKAAGSDFYLIANTYLIGLAAGYRARKREEKKNRERIRKEGNK